MLVFFFRVDNDISDLREKMEEVLDWDDEKRNLVINKKDMSVLLFSDGKNLHGNYWLFIILL